MLPLSWCRPQCMCVCVLTKYKELIWYIHNSHAQVNSIDTKIISKSIPSLICIPTVTYVQAAYMPQVDFWGATSCLSWARIKGIRRLQRFQHIFGALEPRVMRRSPKHDTGSGCHWCITNCEVWAAQLSWNPHQTISIFTVTISIQ